MRTLRATRDGIRCDGGGVKLNSMIAVARAAQRGLPRKQQRINDPPPPIHDPLRESAALYFVPDELGPPSMKRYGRTASSAA
jgi:hypothetical protein